MEAIRQITPHNAKARQMTQQHAINDTTHDNAPQTPLTVKSPTHDRTQSAHRTSQPPALKQTHINLTYNGENNTFTAKYFHNGKCLSSPVKDLTELETLAKALQSGNDLGKTFEPSSNGKLWQAPSLARDTQTSQMSVAEFLANGGKIKRTADDKLNKVLESFNCSSSGELLETLGLEI